MWKDREGYITAIKKAMNKYDFKNKKIAVDNVIKAADLLEITKIFDCEFVNGRNILEEMRIIKNQDKLIYLKKAGNLADKIMQETVKFIKPNITEYDIKKRIENLVLEVGADSLSFSPIIASGTNSSKPHYNKYSRTINDKDIIILDLGCTYKNYCSDMSRTIFVGDINSEKRKIYNIVKHANIAAEKKAKPGVKVEEVDKAARKIITDAGYGEYFVNRTGHGIGLSVHEAPFIKTGNKKILRPGMVFSIEPGIYLPGKFGIRIENIVVITEKGSKTLNNFSSEIIIK